MEVTLTETLLPTEHRVEWELLKLLHLSGPMTTQDAYRALADRFSLTPEQRVRSMGAGDKVENAWANRCRFAKRKLNDYGFSTAEQRGVWTLTEKGHEAARFSGDEYRTLSDYAAHILWGDGGKPESR